MSSGRTESQSAPTSHTNWRRLPRHCAQASCQRANQGRAGAGPGARRPIGRRRGAVTSGSRRRRKQSRAGGAASGVKGSRHGGGRRALRVGVSSAWTPRDVLGAAGRRLRLPPQPQPAAAASAPSASGPAPPAIIGSGPASYSLSLARLQVGQLATHWLSLRAQRQAPPTALPSHALRRKKSAGPRLSA